jgi:hypothetical protein
MLTQVAKGHFACQGFFELCEIVRVHACVGEQVFCVVDPAAEFEFFEFDASVGESVGGCLTHVADELFGGPDIKN